MENFERENFKPNDTIMTYSCNGTGKYIKFVSKAQKIRVNN